ncbi:hypothetical protein MLD38_027518 [Melastoma candidum]|uniref:Uncharacterized protein n=1 Tax=Melastoma candidum TaxID=119954 RepID=A0ACB9P309_9MYRT|nr:hypothetical protein MLD38_027518 [Melastoma candidum]
MRPSIGSLDNGGGSAAPLPDLPPEIVKHILSLLPLKYAMQAALVAKAYKDVWRHSQIIEFDACSFHSLTFASIADIIDRIFAMHDGPIIKAVSLCLLTTARCHESEVVSWIQKAISKGVETLILNFVKGAGTVIISAEDIDISSVRVLKLSGCEIDVLPRARSIEFLKVISFQKVRFTETIIPTLIERCPLLESLELVSCKSFRRLKIVTCMTGRLRVLKLMDCSRALTIEVCVPTLRTFHFHGPITCFDRVDLKQLNDVIICFLPPRILPGLRNFMNILEGLERVVVQTISATFLEGLFQYPNGTMVTEPKHLLPNLEEVQLLIDRGTYINIRNIVSFLLKCPRAERVYIDMNEAGNDADWNVYQDGEIGLLPTLKSPRFVALDGFVFSRNHHAALAYLFLLKAVGLETLVVIPPSSRWNSYHTRRVDIPQYMRSFRYMKSIWSKLNPKVDIKIHNSVTCFNPPAHIISSWY